MPNTKSFSLRVKPSAKLAQRFYQELASKLTGLGVVATVTRLDGVVIDIPKAKIIKALAALGWSHSEKFYDNDYDDDDAHTSVVCMRSDLTWALRIGRFSAGHYILLHSVTQQEDYIPELFSNKVRKKDVSVKLEFGHVFEVDMNYIAARETLKKGGVRFSSVSKGYTKDGLVVQVIGHLRSEPTSTIVVRTRAMRSVTGLA